MKQNVISEDPDMEKSTKELILSKGYPVEEHYVQTEDGFFLGLQVCKNLCYLTLKKLRNLIVIRISTKDLTILGMICREYHIKGANIRTRTVERILWKIVL
jgi:hypothetical protein